MNQHELFISCAPALALQQQFEHLQPEFIAVHDIGGQSSRKLLTAIAAASRRSVQRLSIRRQGFGNELTGLAFVELPTLDGTSLRLYSSESNPDDEVHLAVVRMLFAFSRLGVLMVSEPQPETMADRLGPFRAAISNGPWTNRQLLMLPLIAGNGVLAQGEELVRGTGVNVRTTPQVMRPADAWSYIAGTWGRLREHLGQEGRGLPSLEAAPAPDRSTRTAPAAPANASPANTPSGLQDVPSPVSQPVVDRTTMRPMPTLGPALAQNPAKRGSLDHYVQRLVELPGMVSCCVFDVASGLEVAHAGASPGAADLAMHGKGAAGRHGRQQPQHGARPHAAGSGDHAWLAPPAAAGGATASGSRTPCRARQDTCQPDTGPVAGRTDGCRAGRRTGHLIDPRPGTRQRPRGVTANAGRPLQCTTRSKPNRPSSKSTGITSFGPNRPSRISFATGFSIRR